VYGLLQGVTEVTAKDATHLTGTMDLTAIGGVSGPDQSDIDRRPKAKATPFTATLDATGRLTGLAINGPAADNLAMAFTFAHFGTVKAVSSPGPVSDARPRSTTCSTADPRRRGTGTAGGIFAGSRRPAALELQLLLDPAQLEARHLARVVPRRAPGVVLAAGRS